MKIKLVIGSNIHFSQEQKYEMQKSCDLPECFRNTVCHQLQVLVVMQHMKIVEILNQNV